MKSLVFRFASIVLTAGVMTLPTMAQSQVDNPRSGDTFINKAMESNYAEIRLGCLAESKAENPQVRDFARMMVEDHAQAAERIHQEIGISAAAGSPDVNDSTTAASGSDRCQSMVSQESNNHTGEIAGEKQMSAQDQNLYEKLSRLSGREFDREYVNAMVDDHKKDVREFEREGGMAANESGASEINRDKPEPGVDSRALARELLPMLHKHLQAAETLQRELK